jgi:hypothetical protein
MEKELKDKWTKALRSDDYLQTQGELCSFYPGSTAPARHCCFGVLLEISDDYEYSFNGAIDQQYVTVSDGSKANDEEELSASTLRQLGVSNPISYLLMTLNDRGDYTFKDLADLIDKTDLTLKGSKATQLQEELL